MDIRFEWGTILITFPIVVATVWLGIKFYAKNIVGNHFKKKLEDHKSELQNITEFNKFDLQRKLSDFNLYTVKKHDIYVELFDLFMRADGHTGGLMGYRSVPDYKKYTAKQLEYSLEKLGFPAHDIEEFTTNWDEEKDYKFEKLKAYIQRYEISSARNIIIEAKNKFLLSRLYISTEVDEILSALSSTLNLYVLDVEFLLEENLDAVDRIVIRESKDTNEKIIIESLTKLKEQMQKEISIGYYT